MSGFGQTAAGPCGNLRPTTGDVLELVLYGLDEAGAPAFAEKLKPEQRERLRELATDRLLRCHAVEIWEGPTCVLRLRRPGSDA